MTKDLERRLYDHNERANHHGWTKNYRPWDLIHFETHATKTEALNRERQLKSHQGRQFIREVLLPRWLNKL